MLKFKDEFTQQANIKVVGIGGGGGNAVNRMLLSNIKGVDFVATNTDVQALKASLAPQRLQIGEKLTKGLGVGGNPTLGRQAAEESKNMIKEILKGADMVFITAGLGGGTGTGGGPIIAEVAKELGALTVGVVTKPFQFEGKVRARQAEEGIKELKDKVDTLIVIPNQKLFSVIDKNTSILDAFKMADDILRQAVQSISDIITQHGIVNVDFADVKTIMLGAGSSIMGVGVASGQNRAKVSVEKAVGSPLLEDVSIDGATKVLVNITGGLNLTMYEIEQIMTVIHQYVASEANIIFGAVFDEKLQDEIKVTVIATGFNSQKGLRSYIAATAAQRQSSPRTTDIRGNATVKEEKLFPPEDLSYPTYLRKKKNEETQNNL